MHCMSILVKKTKNIQLLLNINPKNTNLSHHTVKALKILDSINRTLNFLINI